MMMSNKTYDALKWIAQILLPAIASAMFIISTICNLDIGEVVVGVVSALDVLLGALLGISTHNYYKIKDDVTSALLKNTGNIDALFKDQK